MRVGRALGGGEFPLIEMNLKGLTMTNLVVTSIYPNSHFSEIHEDTKRHDTMKIP